MSAVVLNPFKLRGEITLLVLDFFRSSKRYAKRYLKLIFKLFSKFLFGEPVFIIHVYGYI